LKKFILLFLLCASSFSGCAPSHSNSKISLPNKFRGLSTYKLSGFDVNGNYKYWEVRCHLRYTTDRTMFSYGAIPTANFQKEIKNTTSKKGFAVGCEGMNPCTYYVVAIRNHSVELITNMQEFKTFLGPIDTEAELNVWLWAHSYGRESYKKEGSLSYHAIVKEGYTCGIIKKELISVSRNGKITKLKTISSKDYRRKRICVANGLKSTLKNV
jgi:hypothetical protein